ncbi:MAG: MFS transporter [Desulfurococcales archaeon]|nr:MFS transporter [Desulfurococcales archaeon]
MDGQLKRLIIAGLAWGLSWGLLWSVLAPYLRGLGYTGSQYGLVGSTAVLSSAVFTLLGGSLSDRYGSRSVLVASSAIGTLALLLVSTGRTYLVAGGFFLNGMASGLGFVAQQALLARTGRDEELHYTYSYVSAASTLGGGMGSFLGWLPVLAHRYHGVPLLEAYRYSIVASSLILLLTIPVVLGLRERITVEGKRGYSLLGAARRFTRSFYLIAVINMVIGFGAAMSIHNIDYYFTAKYGVTSAELGSVFGLQELAMASLMIAMPRIADRAGGVLRVYLAVSYASIPLLIAMTLVDSFPVAAAIYLVRSVLMNVANPLFTAFVMRLVPMELRGTASAFLSLSWTIPAGGGRAVGGWLLDIDLELPLRLTAVLYTVALTILAVVFRREVGSGGGESRAMVAPGSA